MNFTPRPSNIREKKRKKLIGSAIVLGLIVISVFAAVSQVKVVRQFFSHASGVPANLIVDTQAVLGPMPRPWRNLAQGGEGHDWRLTPLAAQVKAINPEYIRLDHIYDFYEVVGGSPGNLTFDFSKMDPIIDDILLAGAKPYIALSYMPPAISSGDIISPPKRWEDWQLVVQKTIEHISGTRGISDVYYEVWNEPDLFGGWKYYGDKNYLTMYKHSALGAANARGVFPFKIGGPGITALYKNWFNALAKFVIANNLRFDFFSWHRYNHNLDQYAKDMNEAHAWLEAFPQLIPTTELHITEWGHDSENHPGYDNNYGAAHTVAGAISMVGKVDRAFIFEIQDGKNPEKEYWGRWGMFTHSDYGAKPKPTYNAIKMLDGIADQRLQLTGSGSWVKAIAAKNDQGNTEMVIANFDPNGRHSENVPITFKNIMPGQYLLSIKLLNGQTQSQKLATSAAVLRAYVSMPANSVGQLELIKR